MLFWRSIFIEPEQRVGGFYATRSVSEFSTVALLRFLNLDRVDHAATPITEISQFSFTGGPTMPLPLGSQTISPSRMTTLWLTPIRDVPQRIIGVGGLVFVAIPRKVSRGLGRKEAKRH